MKCTDCRESKAEEQCKYCGEYYCEDCAESRNGSCDCETPPSIFQIKSKV